MSSTSLSADRALVVHAVPPPRAAEIIGVAIKTLANWRSLGIGPTYIRYGSGRVAYQLDDLEAFRNAHRIITADGAR